VNTRFWGCSILHGGAACAMQVSPQHFGPSEPSNNPTGTGGRLGEEHVKCPLLVLKLYIIAQSGLTIAHEPHGRTADGGTLGIFRKTWTPKSGLLGLRFTGIVRVSPTLGSGPTVSILQTFVRDDISTWIIRTVDQHLIECLWNLVAKPGRKLLCNVGLTTTSTAHLFISSISASTWHMGVLPHLESNGLQPSYSACPDELEKDR